jgi:hypothetical protein
MASSPIEKWDKLPLQDLVYILCHVYNVLSYINVGNSKQNVSPLILICGWGQTTASLRFVNIG